MTFKTLKHKILRYKLHRFVLKSNKKKLQKRLQRKNTKIMLINKGLHEYAYFDVAFMHNMLPLIVDAVYNGCIPFVELEGRKSGWTNWDTFFEQPFGNIEFENRKIIPQKNLCGNFYQDYKTPFNRKKMEAWCKIYQNFVVLNAETRKYVEVEKQRLFPKQKKILGVKTRGSDFIILKPIGHPIQPDIKEVIELCKNKIREYGFEYIYLASEEKAVEDLFEQNFPNMIIVNQHVAYDKIIEQNNYKNAWEIHKNREDEIKNRGLEYLSSIYLLSKCDALIGGNCGGSAAALYMNNMKYDFYELFDLGTY